MAAEDDIVQNIVFNVVGLEDLVAGAEKVAAAIEKTLGSEVFDKAFAEVEKSGKKAFDTVAGAAKGAFDGVVDSVQNLVGAFGKADDSAKQLVSTMSSGDVQKFFDDVAKGGDFAFNKLTDDAKSAAGEIKASFDNVWTGSAFGGGLDPMADTFKETVDSINDVLGDLTQNASNAASSIGQAFTQMGGAITGAFDNLGGAGGGAGGGPGPITRLIDGFKSFRDIAVNVFDTIGQTASQVFGRLGQSLASGPIVAGLRKLAAEGSNLLNSFGPVGKAIGAAFRVLPLGITAAAGAFSGLILATNKFAKAAADAVTANRDLANSLKESSATIKGMENAFVAGGVSGDRMAKALKSAQSTVSSVWKEIIKDAQEGRDKIEEAMDAVESSTDRVKEAQEKAREPGTKQERDAAQRQLRDAERAERDAQRNLTQARMNDLTRLRDAMTQVRTGSEEALKSINATADNVVKGIAASVGATDEVMRKAQQGLAGIKQPGVVDFVKATGEALRNMTDEGLKADVMMKVFKDSSAEMMAVIQDTDALNAHIASMQRQAEALREAEKAASTYNKAIVRLSDVWNELKTSFGIEFTKSLGESFNSLANTLNENAEGFKFLGEMASQAAGFITSELLKAINNLGNVIGTTLSVVKELGDALGHIAKADFEGLKGDLDQIIQKMTKMASKALRPWFVDAALAVLPEEVKKFFEVPETEPQKETQKEKVEREKREKAEADKAKAEKQRLKEQPVTAPIAAPGALETARQRKEFEERQAAIRRADQQQAEAQRRLREQQALPPPPPPPPPEPGFVDRFRAAADQTEQQLQSIFETIKKGAQELFGFGPAGAGELQPTQPQQPQPTQPQQPTTLTPETLSALALAFQTVTQSVTNFGTALDTVTQSLQNQATQAAPQDAVVAPETEEQANSSLQRLSETVNTVTSSLQNLSNIGQTVASVVENISQTGSSFQTIASAADNTAVALDSLTTAAQHAAEVLAALQYDSEGGGVQLGKAYGGYISGPGGPTSDKVPAWLSNGEFVQSARAVRFWGRDFMDAINHLRMPFSAGGFADMLRLPRFADGGLVNNGGPAVQKLGTVDLRTDHGTVSMMASADAVTQLQRMAVTKRITATGRKPGFVA